MQKSRTIFAPILLFLLLSGILILSWFRFGLMYGGGDTGLPTYNPQTMVNIARYIWWDSLAPGIPVAQGLTSVPLLFFLSIPQALGAGPVFIQGFLFFILLFMMGYGMYLLALSIFSNTFGRSSYLLAISAGVFYLFNPYMMIQIWHRFIHNAIVFAAFLPFLVLTWLWWIRKRHLFYLLLFLIVNFLAVYIYGTIAFIVAVWTLLFLLTLLEVLINWKGRKHTFELFLAFLIGLLFWLLTNTWWLIPTFGVSPALLASQHSTDDSLATLIELSSQTILPYLLRLINPFYLYWHADWGNIYQSAFFVSLSWLFVLMAFVGFISGLRQKAYAAWSLLFLIVIFLSKGAAPPFGFLYIFGFSNFFPLGVIRNPFEKLGILLPFIFAILFALGLQVILVAVSKAIGKLKTTILLIIFILLHMAFFWPMWTGKLFGSLDKPMFVSVPQSYTQANEWIKKDLRNTPGTSLEGRILHLPLPRSEDATYNWEYGYSGVEPSAAIFTAIPSIARGLDVPQVSDALSGLSLIFHKPYASNPAVILKMLQDFNIKYIILHKDMEWRKMALDDPEQEESILDNLPYLKKNAFGSLTVYEVIAENFQPKIVISNNFYSTSLPVKSVFWPWLLTGGEKDLVTALDQNSQEEISNQASGKLIFPTDSFLYQEASKSSILNPDILTNISSQFNQLNKVLSSYKEIKTSKLAGYIAGATDTLKLAVQSANEAQVLSNLNQYRLFLTWIFQGDFASVAELPFIDRLKMSYIWQTHLFWLGQLQSKLPLNDRQAIVNIISYLNGKLVENKLVPKNLNLTEIVPQGIMQVTWFSISSSGSYELVLTNARSAEAYTDSLSQINLVVDGILTTLQATARDQLISFGNLNFSAGEHEVIFLSPAPINLFPDFNLVQGSENVRLVDNSTIQISASPRNVQFIAGELLKAYGGDVYMVSFDFKFKGKDKFYLLIVQDTDPDKMNPQVAQQIAGAGSEDWQSYNVILSPLRLNTQKAALEFALNPEANQILGDQTSLQIRNIRVERLFDNLTFLRTEEINQGEDLNGSISEYQKKGPVLYEGILKLFKPAVVIFKDTYHPGWKLELSAGVRTFTPENRYLGNLYANAWYVDKPGEYRFKIIFGPQDYATKGAIISVSSGFGLLILVLALKVFKLNKKI